MPCRGFEPGRHHLHHGILGVHVQCVSNFAMWFRKNLTSNVRSANKHTSLINTYVNKSYKTQHEQVTSKETNLSTIFSVLWIIRNKLLPPMLECLHLSYTFLSYCKLLKILHNMNTTHEHNTFALSVARPRAKKLSASGGFAP